LLTHSETYINAQCVCELLLMIAQRYGSTPITIVLDNARYQRGKLVQGFAASLGIDLLFLFSYSPNLNLIERFWRFVKKKCLYSNYYSKCYEYRILRRPWKIPFTRSVLVSRREDIRSTLDSSHVNVHNAFLFCESAL